MYIEASNPRSKGHKAWLKSAEYEPTLGRCLSFWYHMYGQHIGAFNVLIMQNTSRSAPIWTLKGSQGYAWKPSRVTIKSSVKHNVGPLRENTFLPKKRHFAKFISRAKHILAIYIGVFCN